MANDKKPQFQWDDPFQLTEQFSEEERMIRDAAAAFAQERLMPGIVQANRQETFDRAIYRNMVNLPIQNGSIEAPAHQPLCHSAA